MLPLRVFNPYAAGIFAAGYEKILAETDQYANPFLQLLGCRWLHAQQNDPERSETIGLSDTLSWSNIVTPDFFMPDLKNLLDKTGAVEGNIIVFSDLPNPTLTGTYKSAALNNYLSARGGPLAEGCLFDYSSSFTAGFIDIPIVPMGCGQNWLPETTHYEKTIFLDEPHFSILEKFEDSTDVIVLLYRHALDTCRRLDAQGYKIRSFCRSLDDRVGKIAQEYPFIDFIEVGKWIPFRKVIEFYSGSSLFFSFATETHGYPIYENMQLGNGVVAYCETYDAYRIKHMQSGVLLSMFSSPQTASLQVDEYFSRFSSLRMRNHLRDDAFKKYSTDTFFKRMRQSFSNPLFAQYLS